MSDIEWSPWINGHPQQAIDSARAIGISPNIYIDYCGLIGSGEGRYRIPMEDYRRIYGDPLATHPNSELDADKYSVGADAIDDSADQPTRSKYHREIAPGVWVDVYDVLNAWGVTNPALQHLIKKALAPGERGHKTLDQDMRDILASAKRAQELG